MDAVSQDGKCDASRQHPDQCREVSRRDFGYWHLTDNPPALANVRDGVTADKDGFWPAMVCLLLIQSGHQLCTADHLSEAVFASIKVLV